MKTIDVNGLAQITFANPPPEELAHWLELYIALLQESMRLGAQLGETTYETLHPDALGQMIYPR